MVIRLLLCCSVLFFISACNAENNTENNVENNTENNAESPNAETSAVSDSLDQEYSDLISRLESSFSRLTVEQVAEAPMAGMLEVKLSSGEFVYTTDDGRFLFAGDVYELRDIGAVDLADRRFEEIRKAGISKLDKAELVTFKAENEQAELYVFTDVTCGYCRRLHQHMDEFNTLGITIHYLAFPRGGVTVPSADTLRAIWCASDPAAAMTEAKRSGDSAIPPQGCETPVDAQYDLGIAFGVRGTPAVFTRSGEQIGGYAEPAELVKRLQLN